MKHGRPKIAHVLNGLKFGGTQMLCLQLIRNSPPDIQHVLFNLNPSHTEMMGTFLGCAELPIIDVPYSRNRRGRFVVEMASALKRVGATSVLVLPFGVHLFVALAARAAGIARVVTHAGNPPPSNPAHRRTWKRIVLASRVLRVPLISCSATVDRELRALAGELPSGSQPLFNGVDVVAIQCIAARERTAKRSGGRLVVGMVARFDAIKDHDTLLRAFARLHSQLPNTELWLVGDGEGERRVEAYAHRLGIAEATRFWGARSDVHALIARMDVLALSTTPDEGFGIVLAEAMAARVPVVASDVRACREVLSDGDAGWLVPMGDEAALAHALQALLTNPTLAAEQAERGHQRALQAFDIRTCARRYCELLLN